jgi:hypothetical protein
MICVVLSNVVCLKTSISDYFSNYYLGFKKLIVLFNLTYDTCKLLLQSFKFMGALYAQTNIEVVFGAIFEQLYTCESYGGEQGLQNY